MLRTLLIILGVLTGMIGGFSLAVAVLAVKGEEANIDGVIGPLVVTVLAADALLYRRRRTHADKRTLGMVLLSAGFAAVALPYPVWRFFNPKRIEILLPFGHAHPARLQFGAIFSLGAEGFAALLLSLAIWFFASLKPAETAADVFD